MGNVTLVTPVCRCLASGRNRGALVQSSPGRSDLSGLLHQRKLFTYDIICSFIGYWEGQVRDLEHELVAIAPLHDG